MVGWFLDVSIFKYLLRRGVPQDQGRPDTYCMGLQTAASALILPISSESEPQYRHKQIFPAGFDSISSSSCSHNHYSLDLDQLLDALIGSYSPHNHVEAILVKNLWYGKETKSVEHEFIIVEVEDMEGKNLKNFMILDRNNGEPTESSVRGISQISSSGTVAKDQFRIAYDGDKKKLLQQCNLSDHIILEQIQFSPGQKFKLYQLATIASVVSERHTAYNVISANCYWFAGLTWECVLEMYPQVQHELLANSKKRKRGSYSVLSRQKVDPEQRKSAYRVAKEKQMVVEADLVKQKRDYDDGRQVELKLLRQTVVDLQNRLDAAQLPTRSLVAPL
ncbi:hypothetical protein OPQ81_002781 [Rhizoctonia solani]|nr:hypothetical protein OPQ81_002781 [Rhizoctonia solani]